MSNRFWRYFHESLNWPHIFRPGPVSVLVRELTLCMDDVREDILWLRRQWTPITSEEDLITGYGESRGVPRMRLDTDDLYRKRVINAYIWHKLGGKVGGMERTPEERKSAAPRSLCLTRRDNDIMFGSYGEHGGDPSSVEFCHQKKTNPLAPCPSGIRGRFLPK